MSHTAESIGITGKQVVLNSSGGGAATPSWYDFLAWGEVHCYVDIAAGSVAIDKASGGEATDIELSSIYTESADNTFILEGGCHYRFRGTNAKVAVNAFRRELNR